jgi:hypothetical protein
MPRPRSSTFYLPLAPLDAPLSLKAKLSVLPPQAANALLAPRARSSTVSFSCTPCSNSDPPNLPAHDAPSAPVEPVEDECARLERVLGCATRAKDGTSRYRAASPELRNDWSTPSPPRSPPRSPKSTSKNEIIHVEMELDPPPVVGGLLTPPPLTPGPTPTPTADHGHLAISEEPPARASSSSNSDEREMVFELDNSTDSADCTDCTDWDEKRSDGPCPPMAGPRATEVRSHRRWSPEPLLTLVLFCSVPSHHRHSPLLLFLLLLLLLLFFRRLISTRSQTPSQQQQQQQQHRPQS